jgi:hypothetical protein
MTTPLTDESGTKFGDGLSIIDRVDSVRGQVLGAAGDRQFRMYVRLTPDAVKMLERSKEFQRRDGQHDLPQGLSDELPRAGRHAVDSGVHVT